MVLFQLYKVQKLNLKMASLGFLLADTPRGSTVAFLVLSFFMNVKQVVVAQHKTEKSTTELKATFTLQGLSTSCLGILPWQEQTIKWSLSGSNSVAPWLRTPKPEIPLKLFWHKKRIAIFPWGIGHNIACTNLFYILVLFNVKNKIAVTKYTFNEG